MKPAKPQQEQRKRERRVVDTKAVTVNADRFDDRVDELISAAKDGTLEEAWGTGTAAVVSPIGVLNYEGQEYTVGNGGIGEDCSYLVGKV